MIMMMMIKLLFIKIKEKEIFNMNNIHNTWREKKTTNYCEK